MAYSTRAILLCLAATVVSAQYGPGGRYGPNSDPNDNDNDDYDNFGPSPYNNNRYNNPPSSRHTILLAHGILASLAFILFFPLGAILIRLSSTRYTYLIHGTLQLLAYLIYTAAFGIGIWLLNHIPVNLLTHHHPIIGILVFVLLFFQPLLGMVHHVKFRKYSKRTVWSYAHLWLGRLVITLGMVNGGLGLLLASEAPGFTGFAPSRGQIVAYGVVAGIMWVLWVVAAVAGERKRKRGFVRTRAVMGKKEEEEEGSERSGRLMAGKELYA
ncbi:hypothetical protein T440DRAFT_499948 [Plenodomus tracheiphilus IPT5]|uniref:Cytochrome b561 domain-containing protein n=1 Tax=Plenodomus tracheiphilus IPT5 TaxID=1408161 RepID=A0A6A7B168_9PLEO|nr:hypothetical protein T440DRAFT_499948 [Plenodomus tracheiphilus IPT5]